MRCARQSNESRWLRKRTHPLLKVCAHFGVVQQIVIVFRGENNTDRIGGSNTPRKWLEYEKALAARPEHTADAEDVNCKGNTMKYKPDDYRRLLEYVAKTLIDAVIKHQVRFCEVLVGGQIKDKPVARAKEEIVATLRATVGHTQERSDRKVFIVAGDEEFPPGCGFVSLSYPDIEMVLGIDHTAAIAMQVRTALREADIYDAAEQQRMRQRLKTATVERKRKRAEIVGPARTETVGTQPGCLVAWLVAFDSFLANCSIRAHCGDAAYS